MYKKKKICTNCRVYRFEKRKKAKMQHCVVQIPQYHNPMTNYYPTPVPYHYQVTTPAAQKARTYELEDYSRDFVPSKKVKPNYFKKQCSYSTFLLT